MFNNASLKTKVFLVAIIVGTIVSTATGIVLYQTNVAPVEAEVSKKIISQMERFVENQIEQKVQGGIMGATAVAIDPGVAEALAIEERDGLIDRFAKIRDQYKGQTNFKNIQTQLITMDGRSLIKSWDLESYGQNLSNSPLIQKLINDKQAFGSLAVGALGVSIIAMSPVLEDGELFGGVAMIQGLASVRKNFTKKTGGQWLLLVDREYINDRYGEMPVIEKNTSFNERFLVANDRWFPKETIQFAQKGFEQVTGMEQKIYFHNQKVIIDLPAMDEVDKPFGRHIFILDEKEFFGAIDEAKSSAITSMIGILSGILFLTIALILVFNKLVLSPLKTMQTTIKQIVSSGDFDKRNEVKSKDEIGQTSEAVNQLLEQISVILKDANKSVQAISDGDFSQRINGHYNGELKKLQDGVNSSLVNIEEVIDQISKVIHAIREANFNIKVENTAKGRFYEILGDSQQAIQATNDIISEINVVMKNMQQGNFSSKVNIAANGELDKLKLHINESMDSLYNAIQEISSVVFAMSKGDLTQTISNEYQGDLQSLKEAINLSLDKLGSSVSLAITSAGIVSQEADKVSSGADSLNTRLQQQASAVEQTSATMEQMNSAVQNNTDTTESVTKVMHRVQDQASEAGEVMNDTIDSMNSIQESSHKIAEIVTLIDGIAFQTNLLALNAAVEAARAGDHGRGFAVVAGEVRALAQKSADAAREIKNLIDASVDRVNHGTELAGKSGQALEQIKASIDEVSGMILQVNTASHEQAEGVNQVHTAITEIDAATQENAALVEQTSSSTLHMTHQAAELQKNMNLFKTRAVENTASTQLPKPKEMTTPSQESVKAVSNKTDEWSDF